MLTEADTCRKFVVPKLQAAGWDNDPHSIAEQRTITDGPYAESKDIIGGYTLVEARDLAEAVELSKGCPILEGGGLVEVRPVLQTGM